MKRHPNLEELCTVAKRHHLHVLLFTSTSLIATRVGEEHRYLESLAVVAPGRTDPIVGGYLGGQLDTVAARLIAPLRRVLKETA